MQSRSCQAVVVKQLQGQTGANLQHETQDSINATLRQSCRQRIQTDPLYERTLAAASAKEVRCSLCDSSAACFIRCLRNMKTIMELVTGHECSGMTCVQVLSWWKRQQVLV